jgi:hypothetical protein
MHGSRHIRTKYIIITIKPIIKMTNNNIFQYEVSEYLLQSFLSDV